MLVVKIELHSAITGVVSELGRMIITNDGTSRNPKRGNYNVYLGRKGQTENAAIIKNWLRFNRVEKHARLSFSVWVLVARALKSVGIERFADFFEEQTFEASGL